MVRVISLLCFGFFIIIFSTIVYASSPPPSIDPPKPDLMVQNIIFSEKELLSNVELDAKILIKNVGRYPIKTKIPYSFGDSSRNVKYLAKSPIIINPGQTIELPFKWQFSVDVPKLYPDEKSVNIILDPLNSILEESENNNRFYKFFIVYSMLQGPKKQNKFYPELKDKNEYFIFSKAEFCIKLNGRNICNKKVDGLYRLYIDEKEKAYRKNTLINKIRNFVFTSFATFSSGFSKSGKDLRDSNTISIVYKDYGILLIFQNLKDIKDFVKYFENIARIDCLYETADQLLEACPTNVEINKIRDDFNIAFDSEPETWSCSYGGDESSLMLSVYNTFRLMKCISFNKEFEWDPEYNNLYEWFKMHKPDLIYYYTCSEGQEGCYNYAYNDIIYLVANNLNEIYYRKVIDSSSGTGAIYLPVLNMHEVRHTTSGGGIGHTCVDNNNYVSNDNNLEQMGAWAVQYYLLKSLSENTGDYFTNYEKSELGYSADNILESHFCDY